VLFGLDVCEALLESGADGIVTEDGLERVLKLAASAFERLPSEALPRGASRDLIRRGAEQRWST
jgi:hypothetical protein